MRGDGNNPTRFALPARRGGAAPGAAVWLVAIYVVLALLLVVALCRAGRDE